MKEVKYKDLEEIKKLIDCMNPEHCECDRCPSCDIFYQILVKKITELTGEKDGD